VQVLAPPAAEQINCWPPGAAPCYLGRCTGLHQTERSLSTPPRVRRGRSLWPGRRGSFIRTETVGRRTRTARARHQPRRGRRASRCSAASGSQPAGPRSCPPLAPAFLQPGVTGAGAGAPAAALRLDPDDAGKRSLACRHARGDTGRARQAGLSLDEHQLFQRCS
jgi:hypothetical protein